MAVELSRRGRAALWIFVVLVGVWMLMPLFGTGTSGTSGAKRTDRHDRSASAQHEKDSENPVTATRASAVPSTAPNAQRANRDRARANLDRQRADAVRQRVASRRAAEKASASSRKALGAAADGAPGLGAELSLDEQRRRREYLTHAVREQYIPVAKSCYEELLSRAPKAAGKVVVSFGIVGDGDAGVVESVELVDGTTIEDREFTLCVRESLYTTIFEPPPAGARETTVVYPLEFAP
jgi:hypothetical protein